MNPRRPVTYCLNLSCIPLICHVSPSSWHESPATSHLLPRPVMYPQHTATDSIPNNLAYIPTTCHGSLTNCSVGVPNNLSCVSINLSCPQQLVFHPPAACLVSQASCHAYPVTCPVFFQGVTFHQQPLCIHSNLLCIPCNCNPVIKNILDLREL
jgi:hypothetical protein